MKYFGFKLFILISFTTLGHAENQGHLVQIGDFDQTHQGFSFKGGLIKVAPRTKSPLTLDLFLDLPHGLGTNNKVLDRSFTGQGAIIDLGLSPLKPQVKIPVVNFKPALSAKDLLPGHSYLVRRGIGNDYGQIYVIKIDFEKALLNFRWCRADKVIDGTAFFDLSLCQGTI